MKISHDAFISYSSADQTFVDDLVEQLKSKGVSIWFDRFEIKPGDYLREKINAAIDSVEYLIAVISPNSIQSEWVRREIDAAMIRELDEKRIRLIPLLIGKIETVELPADLRGKNYLDFRDNATAKKELNRLLELLKPEKRLRKELLKELRAGMSSHAKPVEMLRDIACTYGDQVLQKAAISGLAKIGTPVALVAIAQRFLDFWGVSSLEYCIRVLEHRGKMDGLMIIAGTIFWDYRFTRTKLNVLLNALKDYEDFVDFIKDRTFSSGISELNIMAALLKHTPPEIAAAVKFSSQYWGASQESPFWLPKISYTDHQAAQKIVNSYLPGFTKLIKRHLEFRGLTKDQSTKWVGGLYFDLSKVREGNMI